MGNTLTIIGETVKTTCETVYNFIDDKLDFISYTFCPEKPTQQLALDNMNIPQKERRIIMDLLKALYDIVELLALPSYALSDKKFCTHVYESAAVFQSVNGQTQGHNITSFCEKMLIYISDHNDQIYEPRSKWIQQTITIKEKDVDVPTNLWHKFKTNDKDDVFFYIHIRRKTSCNGFWKNCEISIEIFYGFFIPMTYFFDICIKIIGK